MNWQSDAPPGPADDARVADGPGGDTIQVDSAATVRSLGLSVASVLDVSAPLTIGTTLSLTAGELVLRSATTGGGAIRGGTIVLGGGTITYKGGVLRGVTLHGALDLSDLVASVTVENGIVLRDAAGTGDGTIKLTGEIADLTIRGDATLDNAALDFGNNSVPSRTDKFASASRLDHESPGGVGSTLTLGPNLRVRLFGFSRIYTGALGEDVVRNQTTLSYRVGGGQSLVDGRGVLLNEGTIAVSNGHSLTLYPGRLVNRGVITATGQDTELRVSGFGLDKGGALGDLTISDGARLVATSSQSPKDFSTVISQGGTLVLDGTLTDDGTVLDTARFGSVAFNGFVDGAHIRNAGGAVFNNFSGFRAATIDGSLTLADGARTSFRTSLALRDLQGTGFGAVIVTGAGAELVADATVTLDRATLTLGSEDKARPAELTHDNYYSHGTTLTLGPNLGFRAGRYATIYGQGDGTDAIVNRATMLFDAPGGTATITGPASVETLFVNAGTLGSAQGDLLSVQNVRFQNDGLLDVGTNGIAEIYSAVYGGGSFRIGSGGLLAIYSTGFDQTVRFDGTAERSTLGIADPGSFAGRLSALSAGDRLVLDGVTPTAATLTRTTLTITTDAGVLTYAVDAPDVTGPATVATDADGILAITIACFAARTRIGTPDGDTPVEALRPGDVVCTADGPRPVRWIGHRHLDLRDAAMRERAAPVVIRAGALAEGVPARDLRVSPAHAMLVQGVLIPAASLIDGALIVRDGAARSITYYHVELDRHAILFAEGASTESYLDTGNRAMFANAGGTTVLRPELRPYPRAAQRAADAAACYARHAAAAWAESGPAVAAAALVVAARARALGYRVTEEPDIVLEADGRRFHGFRTGPGALQFCLPPGTGGFRIRSRAGVPAATRPGSADRRRLGARIERLRLSGPDGFRDIALDDPALRHGWHAPEHKDGASWRWTDGDALVPLAATQVALRLGGGHASWVIAA